MMLNIIDFIKDGDGSDLTPAIRRAVESIHGKKDQCLVLAPGRYDVWPDFASERYLFIANNDEGLKRIAFDLNGFENLQIDGRGATLVFHGNVIPFVIENSANIRIQNLSIDWSRTFHSEAVVISSDSTGVDLQIAKEFPFRVDNGRLCFLDEFGNDTEGAIGNILEFDPIRRETAFMARDNYGIGKHHSATDLGDQRVRFTAGFHDPRPIPGNVLAIMHGRREHPGFVLTRTSDVELTDVTIHHAGGMGVIAQRCSDVTLRRVVVQPSPGRLISATADATHFVNCSGMVSVIDCVFENQLDDPLNCHGVYGRVFRIVSRDTVDLRTIHRQQLGFQIADVGSRIEFVSGRNLSTFHEATVKSVERLNREITRISVDGEIPHDLEIGDAVTDLSATCDLLVTGTTVRGNRARGFLVSTPGKVLIENNVIHTPGAGVLIEGDANYWYESGAVRDVLIRGNLFDNCNYGVWGKAAIQITPGVAENAQSEARYHRNIRIEENEFIVFDPRLLFARCVDGLSFSGNKFTLSDEYPSQHGGQLAYDVRHCDNVQIEQMEVEKPKQMAGVSISRRVSKGKRSGLSSSRVVAENS